MGKLHNRYTIVREELFSYIITFRRHHPPTTAYMLYSIGRFLRRTIPSPWNHSRRNCLAAPSGVLVHSTVTRSLLVASAAGSKASQEMAMLIASFGSRTPLGGSMFRRRGLVVLNAKPIRCPPELMICNSENYNNNPFSTMASVPPGDITTLPAVKVIFNAPFDDKHTYYMKIINSGGHRIGFAFKTTNPRRLNMDPPNGVLDPKEAINIAISCDAFDPAAEATNNDRVTVEWTNTPEGAAKQFRREWFQGDGMVRRKNLPIEYNM
uniref:Major sperm protein n=34 Tax=Meloidogyne TaxID=189290 RepID=A0A914NCL8_MELIC